MSKLFPVIDRTRYDVAESRVEQQPRRAAGATEPTRILMVGGLGANSTGTEALLLSAVEDVRAVLGTDVSITVPTLNEEKLRRRVWPFSFARSRVRQRASESLARGYAEAADRVVRKHGKSVALICMDEADEALASAILGKMEYPERARVFSARQEDASRMTALLRSLDLLVTSRFHAAVLSLQAQVPQVAISYDPRLSTLYKDLGLRDRFFIDPKSPGMFGRLDECIDVLLRDPSLVELKLRRGRAAHMTRARQNRALLASFLRGPGIIRGLQGALGDWRELYRSQDVAA